MGQLTRQDEQAAQFKNLAGVLTSAAMRKQMAAALPKNITPERLARVAMSAVQRTPKLLECTPKSFLGCVMACAALGLEPDGLLGQAYLVPFKVKGEMICTLITGYQGLIKLARNSGELINIDAHPVRDGDKFSYRYGADPHIEHIPAERPFTRDELGGLVYDPAWRPGAITHFYAVAKLRDGSVSFVVMPTWEVNAIRDDSSGYKAAKEFGSESPWDTDYDRMGCKTAIRRLSKYLPASVEDNRLHRAVALDERADRGIEQDFGAFVDLDGLPALEAMPAASAPAPTVENEGKRMSLRSNGDKKPPVVKVEGPNGEDMIK